MRSGATGRGLVIFVAAICACASGDDGRDRTPTLGRARNAIQGGRADPTHTFAVAILSEEGVCSGTLIAPNLVLTARHCIAYSGGASVDCSTDTFGRTDPPTDYQITTDAVVDESSPTHAIAKILTPPGKKFCGNDIALLILEKSIDATEATPIEPALESISDRSRYGTTVAAIGYGITSPQADDDGTRRVREGIPIVCVPGDPDIPCKDLSAYEMTETEFVITEGTCTGDSGSSAIEQGSLDSAPVTFGVLSRAGETRTRCTEAIYTRTDSFKDFIVEGAKEASELGGYALPLWAGGTPPVIDAGTSEDATPPPAPAPPPRSDDGGCAVSPRRTSTPWSEGVTVAMLSGLALTIGRVRRRRGTQ